MSDSERGQVNTSAAEVYEEFFIPAWFQEWPPYVTQVAGLQPGCQVVDVACGTGVLARAAAQHVALSRTAPGFSLSVSG